MKKCVLIIICILAGVLCTETADKISIGNKLKPPPNLSINYDDSLVTLQWDSVSSADKYYIYGKNNPYDDQTLLDSTNLTTWTDNFTENKYFFVVTAIITVPAGMVFVEGGTFDMGDHYLEGDSDELPVHSVTLSDFHIGKYEVTQPEWAQYMPVNTYDYGVGDNYPVYYVSWYAILVYCNLRSMAEGITPCYTISGSTDPADWGEVPTNTNSTWNSVTCNWSVNGYRLPSEAEWEYAARGGTNWTDNCRYSGCVNEADLTNYVWYYGNYTGPCHPVGTKAPNQLGIYDMNGNVWEWCWDWYGKSYYTACNDLGIVTDPYGPDIGSRRDARGGYWNSAADDCRIAVRYYYGPSFRSLYSVGFRVSRTP